jgi:phage terminase large subunit GpA-like protein
VLIAFAQSGKTDGMLDIIGERLDRRPAPILYVGPTRDFVIDQFHPRLEQLFVQARSLGAKLARGKRNKKTLKMIAGVTLRLAHGGSSSALKSDPAALALIDEYDEMLRNVRGQGDPLGLVEARGDTYANFTTAIASTPSRGAIEVEDDKDAGLAFWKRVPAGDIESQIWLLFQEGTMHHWAWPCPLCHKYFIPRFRNLHWPESATPAGARLSAWIECPHCRQKITDDAKPGMNARGVFVAPGQHVNTNGTVQGTSSDSPTLSFWVSGLASPFVSWGARAESYLLALESGDPEKLQTVYNAAFGELYAPGGGTVPDWQAIMNLRLPYQPCEVPAGVIFLTAAVDVQKNRLIYVVRGWGARSTSWLIDYGEIWGPTDALEVWSQLDDLLSTRFGGLPIKVAFIDSGFRPGKIDQVPEHRVYEFCRTHQRFVFPTKGYDALASPLIRRRIEVSRQGGTLRYGLELVRLSTDWWKLWVHERLGWQSEQPGAFFLHERATEGYCRQLVSEARLKTPTGRPIWQRLSRENHFLDCEAMNAAAAFMMGAQRIGSAMKTIPPAKTAVAGDSLANTAGDIRARFATWSQLFNG